MATVEFDRIETGTAKTINGVVNSDWGGTAAATTIFDETPSAGVSVTILPTRSPDRVAPEAISFDISTVGFDNNASGQLNAIDVTYQGFDVWWRCRSHAYNFTAPTQVIALDAADSGNRAAANFGFGRIWDYVAQTHGTHIFDVVVRERVSGKVGKGTISLDVLNPATYFAGNATLYVSPNSDWDDEPAGAARYTDIDTALGAYNFAGSTARRIVLARNQTHTLNSARTFAGQSGDALSCVRIEGLSDDEGGTGSLPTVNYSGASNMFTDNAQPGTVSIANSVFVTSNVIFQGPYDPVNITGSRPVAVVHNLDAQASEYILHNRTQFIGFDRGVTLLNGAHRSCRMTMCDTIITDWVSCGLFAGGSRKLAFLGNRIAQNPDAVSDLGRQSVNGPVSDFFGADITSGWCGRVASASRLVIRACDSFTHQGWSPFGDLGPMHAVQATWRIFANGIDAWAATCISHSVFEGGRFAFYLRPSDNANDRRPINGQILGNFIIGGFQAVNAAELAQGHTIWENNLFKIAGNPNSTSDGGRNQGTTAAVTIRHGNNSTTDQDGSDDLPTAFNRNTAISHRGTSFSAGFVQNLLNFTDLNIGSGAEANYTASVAVGQTAITGYNNVAAITPRLKGWSNDVGEQLPAYATPVEAGRIYTRTDGRGAVTKPDYSPLP